MEQSLATIHTGSQTTQYTSSHALVFDPLDSTQPFSPSYHGISTSFQIYFWSLDVTWDGYVNKLPLFLVAIKTVVKEIHCDNNKTVITNVNVKNLIETIRSSFKLMLRLPRLPGLIIGISRTPVHYTRHYIPH